MNLGQRIQEIRNARGISQDAVAHDLGISQVSYSKMERGETDITFSRLEKIAKILQVEKLGHFSHLKVQLILLEIILLLQKMLLYKIMVVFFLLILPKSVKPTKNI